MVVPGHQPPGTYNKKDMIIYRPDGTVLTDIEVDDESYHYAEIMGRDDVTLYFSLPQFFDFPVGCYIEYMAKTYTLYSVDKMRMEHRRDYEYTITFESATAEMGNYILTLLSAKPNNVWNWRGTEEGDFKFPFAGSSHEHLQLIASCMTFKTGVTWTVGSYVDSGDKLITYDTMTCLDALKQVATAFETEYSVNDHTINLGKVEFFTNTQEQITISYGKGNGLRPGVEKLIDTSEKAIGKVYIQGGDRNIDPSKYGSPTLHLPLSTYFDPTTSQTIDRYWWYDGHTVSDTQFAGARRFSCPTGRYISLAEDGAPIGEGALDLSEIYPSFIHTTEVAEEESRENHLWNLYTSEFTAGESTTTSINYGDCLIENGEQLSIIFQNGYLAGRQFGVEWATKEDPENEGQTIAYMKIVASQQDGIDMPNFVEGFYPRSGDQFIVFNCFLPDSFIDKAEMDMLKQALSYLWERMSPRFSIKGEVDPIWSASRWLNIGGHFKPGAYFRFVDPTWENEGVSIRISNVKTFINKPHQPIVEMMSGISRPGVSTVLQKIQAEAKVIPESYNYSGRSFTKRSFADAKETMEMLIKAGLENFSEAINPITVQTMQLLVGDESLQFLFWTDRTCTVQISNPINFNSTTKQLEYDTCALQHMTLGIKDIKPSSDRSLSEYLRWNMDTTPSAVLDDPDMPYYVYAKCDALNNGTNHLGGSFQIADKDHPIGMYDEVNRDQQTGEITGGYYNFLCGILNAERDGERSYAPLNGFSEVLPGQITTDIIRGSSGTSWWDLVQNQINIGNKLTYSPANGLRLQGALVVNGGGNSSVMGVWRGEYLPGNSYYEGDEVWWEDTSTHLISTYRCKTFTPSGNYPSDTRYWEVIAKGEAGNGIDGIPVDTFWKETTVNGTTPPSGQESDWKTTRPTGSNLRQGEFVWKRTRTLYTNGDIYYTYTSEYYASSGDNGPMLVGRGNYDKNDQGDYDRDRYGQIVHQIYYGTDERRDVVYYGGKWYMAKNVGGSFGGSDWDSSQTPSTPNAYWTSFEGNFSNIATGLLFAGRGYINNLSVQYLDTEHTTSGYITAEKNYLKMVDGNGNDKLSITGDNLEPLSETQGIEQSISSSSVRASGGVASDTHVLLPSNQFNVTNAANSVFLPDLKITVTRNRGDYETVDMHASYLIDGSPVSTVESNGFPAGYDETTIVFYLPYTSLSLPVGRHTISLELYAATPESNTLYSIAYEVQTAGSKIRVSYPTEFVQIGANGFRAAFSPSNYFASIKDANTNEVIHTMIQGNNGFRITSSAMQFTFDGGSTWYNAERNNSGYLVLSTS